MYSPAGFIPPSKQEVPALTMTPNLPLEYVQVVVDPAAFSGDGVLKNTQPLIFVSLSIQYYIYTHLQLQMLCKQYAVVMDNPLDIGKHLSLELSPSTY